MKLPTNANHVKVPLSALRITGNVRKEFNSEEIERLAQSIRRDGLMNPITVRPPRIDDDGNKTYEVIAGERRIRAHQWLCDHGDDFEQIECCVRAGDTWTLQMIENIQRADLSPRDKEEAISAALDSGLTMTQIADKLCKPISYVSDIAAGIKVRKAADDAGVSSDQITTKALSQLRSIPAEEQPEAVKELKNRGGSVRAATEILNERKPKPAPTSAKKSEQGGIRTTPVSSKAEQSLPDGRFANGTIVSDIGERLFFKDLDVGMKFVHGDKTCAMYAKVCEVIWKDSDAVHYMDSKRPGKFCRATREDIDSEINKHDDWIFAIPEFAIPLRNAPQEAEIEGGIAPVIEPHIEAKETDLEEFDEPSISEPIAESRTAEKNDDKPQEFFIKFFAGFAHNQLAEAAKNLVRPFNHTILKKSLLDDFFSKLKNGVNALNEQYLRMLPLTVVKSGFDDVGEYPMITCYPPAHPDKNVFTIHFYAISGRAEGLL